MARMMHVLIGAHISFFDPAAGYSQIPPPKG
jgi:hypothetical protein